MARHPARLVVLVVVAAAGLSMVALSTPSVATVATASTITAPTNGTHYFITDAHPVGTVLVTGTSNGSEVDIRCYQNADRWQNVAQNVPVTAGHFSTNMGTDGPYGTCTLRAVPSGYPAGSDTASFTGPRLTTEWNISEKVSSGPNTGKIYNYYIEFQSAGALNDYGSAMAGGLWDSRLSYANGTSSNFLWYGDAQLGDNEDGTRSSLTVDGRNAYGPRTADSLFPNNPGLPALTFSATRKAIAGNYTIRETDPIVVCPSETPFPPTSVSCPQFNKAGVRLDRTIFVNDGGREVHITDIWRSTDGKAHTISAHYNQSIEGEDYSTGSGVPTKIGLKLPWVSGGFKTFTSDAVLPGTTTAPGSVFVRDNNSASDGSTTFSLGAISFDVAPAQVHRQTNQLFTLRDDGIKVPAGGSGEVREDFAMGTTQSAVAKMAAANANQINPYRPDSLIKTKAAQKYAGNHIYNATGAKQTVAMNTRRGSTATFDIEVHNNGTTADSDKMKAPGSVGGFRVTYLAGLTGHKNITRAMTHGSYVVSKLAPGADRIIRLVITVPAAAKIGARGAWRVSAKSTHDASRIDAVKAKVRVAAG